MKLYLFVLLVTVFPMFCSKNVLKTMVTLHQKCRGGVYPRSNLDRFPVPDEKVDWNIEYKDYFPPNYTSENVVGKPWADPDIQESSFKPQWNSKDGEVSRESYVGSYEVKDGVPHNPFGRTGIRGRGNLGRWGPNHAADPLVTRWKRDKDGSILKGSQSHRPILQFVSVQRRDNHEWALPGGMVDPGETQAHTAIREFMEEATNSLVMTDEQRRNMLEKFSEMFNNSVEVYRGYVDDPRNTDNAWMETIAFNYHDETGNLTSALKLKAGSDAASATWLDANSKLRLYASHSKILAAVVEERNADW